SDFLQNAAVNAGHPLATQVGAEVLADGGTAADAAVAVAFAVSVVEPFASGIGGGGSAILVPAGQEPVWYDFREVVPASGAVPESDAGVPGFVRGLEVLHAEHGVLEWSRLLEPAARLAREGHPASQMLADQLRSNAGGRAAGGLPHLYPGGQPLAAGQAVVQEDLARTIDVLAQEGPDAFYDGSLGAAVSAAVGGIDAASLAAYEVQVGQPPSGTVGSYEVVGAAPALPGVALIQMLQVAEALGAGVAAPGSADYVHQLAAAWDHAAATVDAELADPDFVDVPVEEITDQAANAAVAASLAGASSTSTDTVVPGVSDLGGLEELDPAELGLDPGSDLADKPGETTHLTIVDRDGTVVSMTNTLTYFWGSEQYVDGYFLNNQMVRFAVGAGGQNTPQAGRRSVSWGLPAVVLDDQGRAVLGLGSPGGERIPMVLGDVLSRWALHGQSLEEAIAAPRFFASDGEVQFETLPPGEVGDALRGRGWGVTGPVDRGLYLFGSVQALEIDWESGEVTGTVDTRREADLVVLGEADLPEDDAD
uniref:gamma-glutamyltransferase n=1 Tax=Actinotalea sp. C106 TaxID=2908644 RepID=UPI002028ABFD